MIDYHIHIGQFNKIYYDAFEIFEVIEKNSPAANINEIRYSSTSTCRDAVGLSRIEEEISYAQSYNSTNLKIFPYLWYIPKYVDQNITIESATKAFEYCGIKIHTVGQNWDETNTKHIKALPEMFQWADSNQKYLLIHCDQQAQALATRFEHFFAEYTHAKIILAHSCPIYETMLMLNKYDNVFSDVACLEANALYWVDPIVLFGGVSLDSIMSDVDYKGLAIHPFLNDWNPANERRAELLTEVFEFADKHKYDIYFHTGCSERDEPLQFEKWFSDFPNVKVHLAHCKDPEPIIELFSRHENLVGDTAFCPQDSYEAICTAG